MRQQARTGLIFSIAGLRDTAGKLADPAGGSADACYVELCATSLEKATADASKLHVKSIDLYTSNSTPFITYTAGRQRGQVLSKGRGGQSRNGGEGGETHVAVKSELL